jgi:mono/diheme cytochrome c family protein
MLERMLVGKIENRITVGLIAFVLSMVFMGWAAINEGGRMAAFTEMEEARSIEQGAMLFAANCTSCHGLDGRGRSQYGPGLNNPQFFDHDFFPEITSQILPLRGEAANLNTEKEALGTEHPGATPERQAEIDVRVAQIDTRLGEIAVEDAVLTQQRNAQLQPAIDRGYSTDVVRYGRTRNLGWVGTHESFVQTTLIHGRPVSINYWPNGPMAAWSQLAGGPLRMDQIEDLVAYVHNWDRGDEWTLDDLFLVNQFAIEPADPAPLLEQIRILQESGGVLPEAVGTDVATILANLPEYTGDVARGDALYHSVQRSQFGNALGCAGCHQQENNGVGPMTNGTWTRAETERIAALSGYTAEQYIVQSIVQPGSYVVPGFNNQMLAVFGDQLSYQDLADLLAYIETMTQ